MGLFFMFLLSWRGKSVRAARGASRLRAAESMLAAGSGYDHLLTKRRAGHADRGKLSLR
jgi:hypothetical protein